MSNEVTPPYESVLNRLREQKQFHAAGNRPEKGNAARSSGSGVSQGSGSISNSNSKKSARWDRNQPCKQCNKKGHRETMCYIWLATEEGRAQLQKRSKELKEASSGSSDSTEKVTEKADVARKSTGIETAWWVANQPTIQDTWHIDSCTSSHMTYNKALFESINYSDRRDVKVGNGTLLASMGIGTVVSMHINHSRLPT